MILAVHDALIAITKINNITIQIGFQNLYYRELRSNAIKENCGQMLPMLSKPILPMLFQGFKLWPTDRIMTLDIKENCGQMLPMLSQSWS